MKTSSRLKGFTLIELLITMALMSLAVTLTFSVLHFVQNIYIRFATQNKFINDYGRLRILFDQLKGEDCEFYEETHNVFRITSHNSEGLLKISGAFISYRAEGIADSFYINPGPITKEFEFMNNPRWKNKIVKRLQFDAGHPNKSFHYVFRKLDNGASRLANEKECDHGH